MYSSSGKKDQKPRVYSGLDNCMADQEPAWWFIVDLNEQILPLSHSFFSSSESNFLLSELNWRFADVFKAFLALMKSKVNDVLGFFAKRTTMGFGLCVVVSVPPTVQKHQCSKHSCLKALLLR